VGPQIGENTLRLQLEGEGVEVSLLLTRTELQDEFSERSPREKVVNPNATNQLLARQIALPPHAPRLG